jgi:hypothetical protein
MAEAEHPNLIKAHEYREKARTALKRAASCDDAEVRMAWMSMANTYMELGRLLEQQIRLGRNP